MSGTGGGNRDRACIHVSVVSLCADSERASCAPFQSAIVSLRAIIAI